MFESVGSNSCRSRLTWRTLVVSLGLNFGLQGLKPVLSPEHPHCIIVQNAPPPPAPVTHVLLYTQPQR